MTKTQRRVTVGAVVLLAVTGFGVQRFMSKRAAYADSFGTSPLSGTGAVRF